MLERINLVVPRSPAQEIPTSVNRHIHSTRVRFFPFIIHAVNCVSQSCSLTGTNSRCQQRGSEGRGGSQGGQAGRQGRTGGRPGSSPLGRRPTSAPRPRLTNDPGSAVSEPRPTRVTRQGLHDHLLHWPENYKIKRLAGSGRAAEDQGEANAGHE